MLVVLLSVPVHASSARLLPADGAVSTALTPTPWTLHLGISTAASVLAVPAGLYLASVVGSLSNALLWSALPSLLVMGLFAPTVTTLTAWLYGNWEGGNRFPFLSAWGASVLVNALALIAGGFLGLSVGLPLGVLAFGVVNGALLGAASVGTMRSLARPPPTPLALPSFLPGVGDTHVVPLARASF